VHNNPGGGDDARTVLTLVTGPGAAAREAAIAAHLSDLHEDGTQAIILEGLASGSSPSTTFHPARQLRGSRPVACAAPVIWFCV
jgi:hypothetical protein